MVEKITASEGVYTREPGHSRRRPGFLVQCHQWWCLRDGAMRKEAMRHPNPTKKVWSVSVFVRSSFALSWSMAVAMITIPAMRSKTASTVARVGSFDTENMQNPSNIKVCRSLYRTATTIVNDYAIEKIFFCFVIIPSLVSLSNTSCICDSSYSSR